MTDHVETVRNDGFGGIVTSCSCGEQFGNDDQSSYRWLEHAHDALLGILGDMQRELNDEHSRRIRAQEARDRAFAAVADPYDWEAKADYWHNRAKTFEDDAKRHELIECASCGSEFCSYEAREVETGIGADSQDITYDRVCPICWMQQGASNVAEALRGLLESEDINLGGHTPVNQEGAVICATCGDWWSECPVNAAASALELVSADSSPEFDPRDVAILGGDPSL